MNAQKIVGVYSQGKGNFGFIDIEGQKKGYFVHEKNKNNALPGDTVEAEVKMFKGKFEAVIKKVVKRKESVFVGTYQDVIQKAEKGKKGTKQSSFGFVVPMNPDLRNDIFVPKNESKNAVDGDVVAVKIVAWEKKNPEGKIEQILGKQGDAGLQVTRLLLEAGIKLNFSENVLQFTQKLVEVYKKQNFEKRRDLTSLFTFSIDGEDARDLDDAISIKKNKEGDFILYVHIADVSAYVPEGSVLDKEAYNRATSIYLADRVIPMLPEALSNDVCSLNAGTQKLTLTCEMLIGKDGKLRQTDVYNSMIQSDFRLTYKEVDAVLKGEQIDEILFCGKKKTSELVEHLGIAKELQEHITRFRKAIGVLDFDFPETKISFDEAGVVKNIQEYPKYDSNKMIENFMVSANEAVSMKFSQYPFLYRIHEKPEAEDTEKLQKMLNLFGVNFQLSKNSDFTEMTPKKFANLLEEVGKLETAKKLFLEKIILRTLAKAVYSDKNVGHFGLGLDFYSHFTSPIRRYPDLMIHRIIKEKIAGTLDGKRIAHYKGILEEVGMHCSQREMQAEKLEYKVRDYFITQLYKDKIGETFSAVISGVIPHGFFVVLPDTAEGFVEFGNGLFDEETQQFHDLKTGKKYRVGENVSVILNEVDEIKFHLNFILA